MTNHPHNSRVRKLGFSLIEVAAATAIMGLVALIAVSSVRMSSLGNYGAEVDVRDVANQLSDARRLTISTGDNHVLVLRRTGRRLNSYQIHRRVGSSLRPAAESRSFSRDVYATTSSSQPPEFTFEGNAVRTQTIDIAGPNRRWRLTVMQAGGGVTVKER